jgi:Family of unknown function (DUF6348)
MSETILDALCLAFTSHGLECERRDVAARIQDGLIIEPRVLLRDPLNGSERVQVDFQVESPRLGGTVLLDSFAGIGASLEEAEQNAFGKFLSGSFHVIAESLTDHHCSDGEVEWEDWPGIGHTWRVCSGPVLLIATHHGAQIEGFPEFFSQLSESFSNSMGPGPHWMRTFIGGLDGNRLGSEVLVDGAEWQEGAQLAEATAWNFPEGYASCRHLLIALPADSTSG